LIINARTFRVHSFIRGFRLFFFLSRRSRLHDIGAGTIGDSADTGRVD
jgi:hypothetical protein